MSKKDTERETEMKNQNECAYRLKGKANTAKMELISIYNSLVEHGCIKEAEKLDKIIIKLEVWQNS